MAASYFVVRLRPVRGVGNEAALPILREVEKKTFGWMVKRLREANVLDAPLADDLERLVHERNWLVHHSKRENRGVLTRVADYEELLRRLDKLADDATSMVTRLGGEVNSYVRSTGVAVATIEEDADRIRRALGYD